MLRFNAQKGELEDVSGEEDEILSSDPHAGIAPSTIRTGDGSTETDDPAQARTNSWLDTLEGMGRGLKRGAVNAVNPVAIGQGLWQMMEAMHPAPEHQHARDALGQGLKAIASGDPEAGGEAIGGLATGLMVPHILPPALRIAGKGIGAAGSAATRLGEMAPALKSVQGLSTVAGAELMGETIGIPRGVTAGAAAGIPPALRGAGYLGSKLGKALEGLGGSADAGPVVERGADMYSHTPEAPSIANRIRTRVSEALGGVPKSAGQAAEAMPDEVVSGMPDGYYDSAPDVHRTMDSSIQHGADMYAPGASDGRTASTTGTVRHGGRLGLLDDIDQFDPSAPDSPLAAAARQSRADVHAASVQGLDDPPIPFDVVEPETTPQTAPTSADVDALVNEAQNAQVPTSVHQLTPDDLPEPATSPVSDAGVDPVPMDQTDLPASLQALGDVPEQVPVADPITADPIMDTPEPFPEPAMGSPALQGLSDPVYGPEELPLDNINRTGQNSRTSMIDPELTNTVLRDEIHSEGTTPERAELLRRGLRQRAKIGQFYYDKMNPPPAEAAPTTGELPASWQALVDPAPTLQGEPVVEGPPAKPSPKSRRKYTNTNAPRK